MSEKLDTETLSGHAVFGEPVLWGGHRAYELILSHPDAECSETAWMTPEQALEIGHKLIAWAESEQGKVTK